MRNVKLFLASGNALKKDRDEIMLFLANKNQFLVKHGIFLELVRWEFLSSSFSETRKQDDFNKELDESEIFTCLIFDRIGQYTREEFDKAYQNYKEGKNPKKFYLYFKTLPKRKREEAIEVYELRKAIEKDEQIYREYKNPDQLKLFLNQNLDADLPGILKETLLENIYDTGSKPMIETIPQDLLDSLDDADKMLNRNLTEEALEVYLELIRKISKQDKPVIFAKMLISIAICYRNISYYEKQEKNLVKSLIKIDEALKILDPFLHKDVYLLALNEASNMHFHLSNIRNRFENLNKTIHYSQKMIDLNATSELLWQAFFRIANSYQELMAIESNSQYFTKAEHYYQLALDNIEKNNKMQKEKVLSSLGVCLIRNNLIEIDLNRRIEILKKGISFCEESLTLVSPSDNFYNYGCNMQYLCAGYFYLGSITKDIEFYKKSLDYNSKGITLFEAYDKSAYFLLYAYINQSACLSALFELTKSEEYLNKADESSMNGLKKITIQSHPYMYARFHLNIGTNHYYKVLFSLDSKEKKIQHLKESLEEYDIAGLVLSQSNYPNEYKQIKIHEAKSMLELSKYEDFERNWNSAKKILQEVISGYDQSQVKDSFYDKAKSLFESMINEGDG